MFSRGIIAIEGTFSSGSDRNIKNKNPNNIDKHPMIPYIVRLDFLSNFAETIDKSVSGNPCEVIQ